MDVPRLLAVTSRWFLSIGRADVVLQLAGLIPADAAGAAELLQLGEVLDRSGYREEALLCAEQALRARGLPESLRLRLVALRASGALPRRGPGVAGTAVCASRAEPLAGWLIRALVATDRYAEARTALTVVETVTRLRWHGHWARLYLASGDLRAAATEVRARAASDALWAARAEVARYCGHALADDHLGTGCAGGTDVMWVRVAGPAGLSVLPRCLTCRMRLFGENPMAAVTVVKAAQRDGREDVAAMAVTTARSLADGNPGIACLEAAAAHAEGIYLHDLPALELAADRHRTLDRGSARADSALVQAGARRSATGWDSLTTAELRVVFLLAQGLTNREAAQRLSVSPHTVNSHVRHVFTKLDINRRVELVGKVLARTT